MIAQLTLFTLKPDVTPERLEEMMWITRTTLLKIPEVLSLRTGKRIKPGDPWDWFVADRGRKPRQARHLRRTTRTTSSFSRKW